MPKITNHEGNAKGSHHELLTSYPLGWPPSVKQMTKCWWGYGETGTPAHYWRESKMEQPLWKTIWWLPKKSNLELPYDLKSHFLDVPLKGLKAGSWQDICTHSIFHNSQTVEATQVSIDQWMANKMWHMPTMEYYSAWVYVCILIHNCYLYNMDEPWGYRAEWNKLDTKG